MSPLPGGGGDGGGGVNFIGNITPPPPPPPHEYVLEECHNVSGAVFRGGGGGKFPGTPEPGRSSHSLLVVYLC